LSKNLKNGSALSKSKKPAQERWQLVSDSPSSLLHDMLKPLLVIAIVIVLFLFVSEGLLGLFSSVRLIGTRGNIKSPPYIAIYQNSNCTSPVSYIDWGSVEQGMARNTTLYIRNEGNGKTSLSLDTTNWQPANISNYMNLTWNYNGEALFPSETVQVTLTLSSSSSPDFTEYLIAYDVTEFSFDIIINAFS